MKNICRQHSKAAQLSLPLQTKKKKNPKQKQILPKYSTSPCFYTATHKQTLA